MSLKIPKKNCLPFKLMLLRLPIWEGNWRIALKKAVMKFKTLIPSFQLLL